VQDAADFAEQGVGQTWLREEDIAAGAFGRLTIRLPRAGRQDDNRFVRRSAVRAKAANQFEAVEWTWDSKTGHDDVGGRGERLCVTGIADFDGATSAQTQVFRIHAAIVVRRFDEEDRWDSAGTVRCHEDPDLFLKRPSDAGFQRVRGWGADATAIANSGRVPAMVCLNR
jgi:hypothetical protein